LSERTNDIEPLSVGARLERWLYLGLLALVIALPLVMTPYLSADTFEGLTGRALRQFQTAYEKDFDGGKIRVRVYKTIDVKVIGMQFGVPEAIYKFTDNSYYIDTKTRQPVSQPLNVKREWALGLAKDAGGHWKVSLIMGAARNSKHP